MRAEPVSWEANDSSQFLAPWFLPIRLPHGCNCIMGTVKTGARLILDNMMLEETSTLRVDMLGFLKGIQGGQGAEETSKQHRLEAWRFFPFFSVLLR